MSAVLKYISDIAHGIKTLVKGMQVTGYYFSHARKEIITQQYPENREDLQMFDRFRGIVEMPHDENNQHTCTGCSACEVACPNGSIEIISKRVEDPETGRKKKTIDQFVYHYSMCTLCNLCILSCPTDAIIMGKNFEHSVFDRKQLTMNLNEPGSTIRADVKE